MNRLFTRACIALLGILLTSVFGAAIASAHGHTTVGDYELVIGFHNEPAYQSQPNGLDLFVTNAKTGEKINDLADTLKAEISFGGTTKALVIEPQWGEAGAYTAYVLPTKAGDYTWHIFGTIRGTPVDVAMTSSPTTFGSVAAKNTVAFPAAEATAAELAAEASAAAHAAQTALLVGGAGALLGLIGIVVGLLGMRARRAAGVQAAAVRKPA